jgi:hypothetical protein
MKKLFLGLALLCQVGLSFAQNVTITPSGITPAQGGGIDRLTTTQRLNLTNQNAGKIVFDIDKGHLYLWNGNDWHQIADSKLDTAPVVEVKPLNQQNGDRFGFSVAIKSKWAVVGAPGRDSGEGEAYIFERKENGWEEVIRLRQDFSPVNTLLGAGDGFGHSVDIDVLTSASGEEYPVAIVGAPVLGRVFIYRLIRQQILNTSNYIITWSYETNITHPSAAANDLFGQSLAISGNRIIVGVPGDDPVFGTNPLTNYGSACIYDATQTGLVPNATFSWNIVGSTNGQATIFRTNGATGDNFGTSVDIGGNYAVISSVNNSTGNGRVDMYRFVSGSWTFLREFTPTNVPDVDPAAFFGRAIALRGDLLVIGVPGEDNNTTADVGAIQAIRNSAGGTWTSSSMVTYSERMNPYLVANAQFGASVAVSTRSVMGGAPEYDDPASAITNVGLAAGFTNGTSYTHEKIENPSKSSGRQYGRSVAISDDGTFVIGAAPETSATWAGPGRVYFGNINL